MFWDILNVTLSYPAHNIRVISFSNIFIALLLILLHMCHD